MERRIVEVSQLNAYIKNTMDSDFLLQNIWVRGELSNFKLHYSGHMYMSLKDSEGVLRAVMFRGAAQSLRFMPENGMQVLARGRVSVFPRDGAYQLYIEEMEPEGAGALSVAFEQMKAKLEKEGLFAPERKKIIPRFPSCIGVATSATGAAVQDICNILRRRWPMAKIVLHPVTVQGEGAAAEIASAIRQFNLEKEADVLIVGRGGGSQEDLWAFNEEILARAVADSAIPIISAVGHETDFTICDFVADLRAPTPSAAAELAVPDREEVLAQLASFGKRISSLLALSVSRKKENLLRLATRMRTQKSRLDDLQYTVDTLTTRAVNMITANLERGESRISENAAKLQALSPLQVLARGYTVGTKNGQVLRSVGQVIAGDVVSLRFSDGSADCTVETVERRTGV
ncbi:MAG: exodeoxyribonuclease VII large subunit [Ruminococcaceae bacterium]|nr:exodeoxyribonuclease VII large subunit [Oscillospiraceae bacterium]